MRSIEERFWSKVDKNGPTVYADIGPCWIWTSTRCSGDYGSLTLDHKRIRAHRMAYELANGTVPEGLFVIHRCDNPPCVRPEHLRAGSHRENMGEMAARGRSTSGARASTAKLSDENVAAILARLESGETQLSIARHCGVSEGAINAINRGITWRHVQRTRVVASPPGPAHFGSASPSAKLTEDDVRELRRLAAEGVPTRELVKRFEIHETSVRAIKARRKWRHVA